MRKKLPILLLICAMLSVFICGCAPKTEKPVEYIGIISAMDNEIDLLLEEAEIDRVDTIADVEFTGIAGGVADETAVLDQVVATRLVEHDYGILSNDGFEWRSGDPGLGGEQGVYYECDPQLVQLAYDAAVEVVGEEHAFKGTIATGDQFIANSEYVEKLQNDYDAYACEMEGAAIAVVCIKNETPFVVIRALSDKADGNAHDSYENFGETAADNSSRIVIKMLDSISGPE